MTTLESLKAKRERIAKEAKELSTKIKTEEAAELKRKQDLEKLDQSTQAIGKAVQAVLDELGIALPQNKAIDVRAGETGLVVSIVDLKTARKGTGGGGGKGTPVKVNGVDYPSAAAACRAIGIDYGVGAATVALERAKGKGIVETVEPISA